MPVQLRIDDSEFAKQAAALLEKSPRFKNTDEGLVIDIAAAPRLSICLKTRSGKQLSCYTSETAEDQNLEWNAKELVNGFHTTAFGLGYEISKAKRSMLLGSSVILSSQNDTNLQRNRDAVLNK